MDYLRGDWMATYTGGRFYPSDPRAEDVRWADVAHAADDDLPVRRAAATALRADIGYMIREARRFAQPLDRVAADLERLAKER